MRAASRATSRSAKSKRLPWPSSRRWWSPRTTPIIGKTIDGIITSWNPAATRLYGYAAEEAIGKPITLLAPPDRIDEFRAIFERVQRGERVERAETTRLRKDGTRVEVALAVSPILDPHG